MKRAKEFTVTIGRTMSLAPYESLRIEVTETYEGTGDPEARDKAVERLSKRLINLCALESKRHMRTVKEDR